MSQSIRQDPLSRRRVPLMSINRFNHIQQKHLQVLLFTGRLVTKNRGRQNKENFTKRPLPLALGHDVKNIPTRQWEQVYSQCNDSLLNLTIRLQDTPCFQLSYNLKTTVNNKYLFEVRQDYGILLIKRKERSIRTTVRRRQNVIQQKA